MKTTTWLMAASAVVAAGALLGTDSLGQRKAAAASGIEAARFESDNALHRPTGYDDWVFLGASMGLTYFGNEPDPEDPGLFSSVYMAPEAYRSFMETGVFPDGTMFVKEVHDTVSADGGFSMGELLGLEVHIKDAARFPENGFNFYFFGGDAEIAPAMPEDNICVSCHQERAAHDNVFTQFYPKLRERLNALGAD